MVPIRSSIAFFAARDLSLAISTSIITRAIIRTPIKVVQIGVIANFILVRLAIPADSVLACRRALAGSRHREFLIRNSLVAGLPEFFLVISAARFFTRHRRTVPLGSVLDGLVILPVVALLSFVWDAISAPRLPLAHVRAPLASRATIVALFAYVFGFVPAARLEFAFPCALAGRSGVRVLVVPAVVALLILIDVPVVAGARVAASPATRSESDREAGCHDGELRPGAART